MEQEKFFVIDFDSTFTQVEGLDVLCEITLEGDSRKEEVLHQIQAITNASMEGRLTFSESLERRIALLPAHRKHIPRLIDALREKVSVSFRRNRVFFEQYSDQVYVISNGFRDFIVPIVTEYGIRSDRVFANSFTYDGDGKVSGYDKNNVLASNNGKVKLLQRLNLPGEVYVIGDGYNDYQIREAGLAHKFYAFTENITRDVVLQLADTVAPSLDEVLYQHKMNKALSYPKNRIKVLLLENVHPKAEAIFKEEGYTVEVHPAGMDEDELAERIKGVSIIGIRSKTRITKKVLDNANRLLVVGAFCIGTNQINLDECERKGVAVFNAPFSNTRSVVELAIAEIVMLMRNLPDKVMMMHEGKWAKSAKGSHEVRGKKLGIVGYGNIGAQLSVLAEAMGMDVYFYDIVERLALGNATKCNSLHELLSTVDIVTLHVDGRPDNRNIFGAEEFNQMRENAIFLNLSRGFVVDIPALKQNLEAGKLAGAAIDVFPEEPKSNKDEFVSELRGLPNLIMTPHIGGSTQEAQENIGEFVPSRIIDYINTGSTTNSVNFPNVQLPGQLDKAHRFLHIHHNKPGVLASISRTLAEHEINVLGQYLKTSELIGYVIVDCDKNYDDEVVDELKNIDHTIRFRMLY